MCPTTDLPGTDLYRPTTSMVARSNEQAFIEGIKTSQKITDLYPPEPYYSSEESKIYNNKQVGKTAAIKKRKFYNNVRHISSRATQSTVVNHTEP